MNKTQQNRKSFILHIDSLDILEHLTDEQSGQLFKAIKSYMNGEEILLDALLNIAFIPIKNQLDRDLLKYNSICARNKANGLKGGRPAKPKKPTGLSGNPKNPSEPKKADSDNDSDNDSDSDSDSEYKSITKKQKALTKVELKNDFDKFYSEYPKHVGEEVAKNAWLKIKAEDKLIIFDAIANQKLNNPYWVKGDKQYIKAPAVWLNGKCWKDEFEPIGNKNSNSALNQSSNAAMNLINGTGEDYAAIR